MEKYTRERLLAEYAEGKRDFGAIDLSNADLRFADLHDANLSWADLRGANLGYANLSWADLRGANLGYAYLRNAKLRGADLRWAIGNGNGIKSMQFDKYMVTYTSQVMAIGCEQHTIEEWRNFSDDEIQKMNDKVLEGWSKWKQDIFSIVDKSFKEEI